MDLRLFLLLQLLLFSVASANLVFKVHSKFKDRHRDLTDLKAHDLRRHARFLFSVDLPLGGVAVPTVSGLYFTKIGLGSPSKDYYVQVDTGSDLLWVNCAGCQKCPTKSDLGIELKLYDPKSSSSSKVITCDDDFCISNYNALLPGCKSGVLCPYDVEYGDGSKTAGYFVKDTVHLAQVSGNLETSSMNGTLFFGCGAKQSGELGAPTEAVDGILGLGQSNSSMISQLATAGKVKKMFAHCLDNEKGGGIFAIGEVVQPDIPTTPLIPNQAHYNVVLKDIEVGDEVLQIPSDTFDNENNRGVIIDSGTTLAYLPDVVYKQLMDKIMARQTNLKLSTVEETFVCFSFTGSVNDEFPIVKFHFKNSLTLTVYPNEYLFPLNEETWCSGWQSSGKSNDGQSMTLLGDLVLSNKLVLYDLENQALGWTKYNCSSSIKVKDERGAVYEIGAHNISAAVSQKNGITITLIWSLSLILIAILLNYL